MADAFKCPHCGRLVTHTGLGGLCPECLLKAGAPTQAPAEEAGPNWTRIVRHPPSPTLGDVAKHFPQLEILECLGRGGMGVVYKARQLKLNRLVALKLLAPERGEDPEFAKRFEREAQALARLNHPHIVAVHDFGETEGFYYLVMEYVDGASLRQFLQAGHLAPEQALAIVPQICEALQFAHGKGIVHRDIKPENVLLDKEGQVKIADFGIAKIVGQEGGLRALTQDQQVIGTPHYMAPEQVEKPAQVDHRADIYSLGVVFYEMLTGELPLGKFAPPSSRMRGVQVDVRLDEVVLRALEKEPERRYQQASQVKTDVETISGQGTGGGRERRPHFALLAEHPWLFLVGGLPFLACVAFGIRLDQPFLGALGWAGWMACLVFFFTVRERETEAGKRVQPPPSPIGHTVVWSMAVIAGSVVAFGVFLNRIALLILAAGCCVIWGIVSAFMVAHALEKRGIRVNYLLLGPLLVLKYLTQYRLLTLRETGKVGPLFYSYVVAMNLALVAVVLAWGIWAS